MKMALIGAGSMGSLFGGYLALGGHDVCLIDVDADHIAAINKSGLAIETEDGVRIARPRAGRSLDFSDKQDYAIVFTKGMHTEPAMASVMHLMDQNTWVLTAQNGLGNAKAIARHFPSDRIAIGTTSYAANLVAPGRLSMKPGGSLRLWSANGVRAPAVERLAEAIAATGLDCATDPNVEGAIWEKVAFNAAINSLTAVLRCPVGGLTMSTAGRTLAESIVREVATVAAACGVAFDLARVHELLDLSFTQHRQHKPSMLCDVLAGRETEIENINGAVLAEARRFGIPVPATETLLLLVRLVDQNNKRQNVP